MKTDREANRKLDDHSERIARIDRAREMGLCATCRHVDGCSLIRSEKGPVVQCEEFEIEGKIDVGVHKEPVSSKPPAEKEHDDGGALLGLCSNCDLRSTCTFPKPEAGVWHCEEYE